MRHAFTLGTLRQALAATAVIVLATTATTAQDNQQSGDGEKAAANAKQAETKQDEAVVLKVIKFKSMSVTDFLSAARLSGVVDQTANYSPRQPLSTRQQQPDAKPRLYLGHKPDSSVLFVRGPEKKVNKIEDLAKKLDVAPEARPETLQLENGKQARRLPQSEIAETGNVLRSLGLATSPASFGDTHYLVFEETEESRVKQIEQVLEALSQDRAKEEKSAGGAEQASEASQKDAKGDAKPEPREPEEKAEKRDDTAEEQAPVKEEQSADAAEEAKQGQQPAPEKEQ